MAKDEAFRISADQLIETAKNRPIIHNCLSLDLALSGGVPLGSCVLIGGKPKSSKTTMSLQYAANAQNTYGSKVFLFPIEGRLTNKVLEQVRGIKTDAENFNIILPPPIKDKDGNVVAHQKWPSSRWWTEIGKTIAENPKSIIIVDSISSLSSEKEMSEGVGYIDRGTSKKDEASFCRQYGSLIISNQVTLFLLAQVIANPTPYGPPLKMKAGNAIVHQSDIIMMCRSVAKWKEQNGKILGQTTTFTIEESALGSPHTKAEIGLRFGYGLDDLMDITTQGLNWQKIERHGAWYKLPFVEKDGDFEYTEEFGDDNVKLQGENAIRNWFMLHPEKAKMIENKIRDMIFGGGKNTSNEN